MLCRDTKVLVACFNFLSTYLTNLLFSLDEFIQIKSAAVSALSHMLRRYTSLNHLSTAACAVLKNQQQVSQMISDLNKVDFKNVQVRPI